jgi:hypothetical protein
MRTPVLRGTPSSESQAWLTRVRENFCQLFTSTGLSPSSSNGAPIHLLKLGRSGQTSGAQTVSLLTHAGILLALVFFAVQTRTSKPLSGALIDTAHDRLIFAPSVDTVVSRPSLGHNGGGGDNDPIPTTHGFLAPRSSVQLVAPRLPDNLNHQLPVPVTILDAQAPPMVAPVSDLGLPWMPKDTNSAAPEKTASDPARMAAWGTAKAQTPARARAADPMPREFPCPSAASARTRCTRMKRGT